MSVPPSIHSSVYRVLNFSQQEFTAELRFIKGYEADGKVGKWLVTAVSVFPFFGRDQEQIIDMKLWVKWMSFGPIHTYKRWERIG